MSGDVNVRRAKKLLTTPRFTYAGCVASLCNSVITEASQQPDFDEKPGYIYFITASNGRDRLTKIGLSNNPQGRVLGIRTHFPPFYDVEIELSASFVIYGKKRVRFAERCMHEAFREYHVDGEWFRLPDSGYSQLATLSRQLPPPRKRRS